MKIVAKQGYAALKLKNGPRRPLGGAGAEFLASGDLPIMPRPDFRKKFFAQLTMCMVLREAYS